MFEHHSFTASDSTSTSSTSMHASNSTHRALPRIDSGRLLDGGHELVIDHAGQEYRLRLTRNDKLILTK